MSPSSKISQRLNLALLCLLCAPQLPAQSASPSTPTPSPFARHYTEGEKLTYHMKGNNDGWTYEVQASGIVKKNADGHFVEEYAWSKFNSNAPMSLSPASLNFRQSLSLDPAIQPSIPDLSQVQPFLIGPITDLLTVYSDLWLAIRQSGLTRAGDHAYVKFGSPSSWADGTYVILGEDSIDFDLTLEDLDTSTQVADSSSPARPPAATESEITRAVDASAGGRHAEQLDRREKECPRKIHCSSGQGNFRRRRSR